MKRNVAIVGAGGKMGARAVEKLGLSDQYFVLACESDDSRAGILENEGVVVTPLSSALPEADFVVLAVPDALIGRIAAEVVPHMRSQATLIMLDAAAAYIDELPPPRGLNFMLTHPCHPSFFFEQPTPEARRDYFGGIGVQDILVSLVHGSESSFEAGIDLCKAMFAPVGVAHRVSLQQAAILEPAMSEIVVAMAACLMKASMDVAVSKGVPVAAAESFMAGHVRIALAIAFGVEKSPFSDAAKIAIDWGTKQIIRPDWQRVFEPEVLRDAIRVMLRS